MIAKEIIGYSAAFMTTAGFLPQLIQVIRTKQTKDISLWMYITLITGLTLWLIYGICKSDWPIILANAVTLMLVCPILILKLIYK